MLQTLGMCTISKESVKESKEYSPSWFDDFMNFVMLEADKQQHEQKASKKKSCS